MRRKMLCTSWDLMSSPSFHPRVQSWVAREMAVQTTMTVEGMDYKEMARYAWLGDRDGLTSGVEEVRRLLPVKNSTRGTGPGFKNKEVNAPEKHTEISWTFPNCTPTTQEKRELFGIMVEIGIRVLFTDCCYKFGGQIFLQQVGGPGAR